MSLTADREIGRVPGASWPAVDRRAEVRPRLTIATVSPDSWDGAVADFDDVVQEQLCAYARIAWPWGKPEAVLFSVNGEMVGGALVMIRRLPLGVGSIAVCKWGPMLKRSARPDALLLYGGMVDALVAQYAVQRRMTLSIMPRAAVNQPNRQFEHLVQRGFRPGVGLAFPDRYIVRLGLQDEAQRRSLGQKWRYHLNKAEKAGLSFERAAANRLGEFDALYGAMLDRKNFADHSAYGTVPSLFAASAPELRPELFFVRHEGEVVAGAIVFKAGVTAVYLFGATNGRALPLRAGYFLHWHIIGWLREHTRAQWYDLGGTDGYQGLHQFKKGMVGDAGVIVPIPLVASFAASWLPRLVGEAAFAAREVMQQARRRVEGLLGGKSRREHNRPAGAAAEER